MTRHEAILEMKAIIEMVRERYADGIFSKINQEGNKEFWMAGGSHLITSKELQRIEELCDITKYDAR